MVYTLFDISSTEFKKLNNNYYGINCEATYFITEDKLLTKKEKFKTEGVEILPTYTGLIEAISTYLSVLLTKNILNINSDRDYYIIISNNSFDALKEFWGSKQLNIYIVKSYEEFDNLMAKFIVCGLYDDSLIRAIIKDLDYNALKKLESYDDYYTFIELLSLFLKEKYYNDIVIAYLAKILVNKFREIKLCINKETSERKIAFARAYNKFLEKEFDYE